MRDRQEKSPGWHPASPGPERRTRISISLCRVILKNQDESRLQDEILSLNRGYGILPPSVVVPLYA